MKFDKIQTEAWVEQMQKGNMEVYEAFYQEWYPRAFYIALAITQNEADAKDAAQDTMIQIHNSIMDLRDPGYFKLWLNRIIISKCNRIFRKRKAPAMSESQLDTLQNQIEKRSYLLPVDESHKASDDKVLLSLIRNLSPIYQEILALMYFEQLSIKEITDILKIPEGTVKSRLNAARSKLRCEVEAYERAEDIILDFHGIGFDAVLMGTYATYISAKATSLLVPTMNLHKMTLSHKATALLKSHWLGNIGILSLVGVTVVGGGMALRAYQSPQEKGRIRNLPQEAKKTSFQEMTFKDITIHNSKDAYFILMKYAHCENELYQLSEDEQKIIHELQEQLDNNSEIYANLYKNSKK